MGKGKQVIIIGGGIIGLCSAYYLWEKGHTVTIIERNSHIGQACSLGNAGLIVPSHFIPLASPGMIAKGIKWMFDAQSPFYIKPRFSWELISWGLNFYRSATQSHVQKTMHVLRDLSLESKKLYEAFATHASLDFDLEKKGLLMLYKTEAGEKEELHVAELAHSIGMDATVLNTTDLHELEPAIEFNVKGGVYYPQDAHLNPAKFTANMAQFLEARDVQLQCSTEVLGFEKNGSRITKVRTTQGDFEADEFIVAGGSWSPGLVRDLEINLPIQAGKGYSLMSLSNGGSRLRTPAIFVEARVSVTPLKNGIRFGGTMEINGFDQSINPNRINGLLKSIPKYFPEFTQEKINTTQIWSGLRPCSPDGLPYIGRFKKYKNLIAATGHAMVGVSLAPVTGKLVAEITSELPPCFDLATVNPDRFN